MVDAYLRQSPLAHLHLDARAAADTDTMAAGLTMGERRYLGMINLRGDARDPALAPAVKKALGVELPDGVNRASGNPAKTHLLGLGPDEWLVVTAAGTEAGLAEKLRKATQALHAAVTLTGEARTVIRLDGPAARDVLAKGCPLDLHPRAFGPGDCAQTILARADMMLHQTAANEATGAATYDVFVLRSFAEYVWTWLEDAGREYGVAVAVPNG